MGSFFYFAFGLRIESDTPVAGVAAAAPGPVDLRLHLGSIPKGFGGDAPRWGVRWRSDSDSDDPGDIVTVREWDDGSRMAVTYADGTHFVVTANGTEIWASWTDTSSAEATATYLLGPVIGFALRLRGTICLHASAVVLGGRVVALTGRAGAGKSTTAASLALRGHRVIADDIVVLERSAGAWTVRPSVPGVRLWEDSVQLLLGAADALPRLSEGWEKRVLDLRHSRAGFAPERTETLGAVYLLERNEDGPAQPATRLSGRDALIALVANTYANVLLTPALRRLEFEALAELVRRVPVWRVPAPASASDLQRFCEAVERATDGLTATHVRESP